MKNKVSIVIAFIIGVILSSCVTVYATSYFAKDISYKDGKSVADALNYLYSNEEFYLPTFVTSSGEWDFAYGWIVLPDLTNYSTLKIDSVTKDAGVFKYLRLEDSNGTILASFLESDSEQTIDISTYTGTGYKLRVFCMDMGKTYQKISVNGIRLTH